MPNRSKANNPENTFSSLSYVAFENRLFYHMNGHVKEIPIGNWPNGVKAVKFTKSNLDVFALLLSGVPQEDWNDCRLIDPRFFCGESPKPDISRSDLVSRFASSSNKRKIPEVICEHYNREDAVDRVEKHFETVFEFMLKDCRDRDEIIDRFIEDLEDIIVLDHFSYDLSWKKKILEAKGRGRYWFMAEAFVHAMTQEQRKENIFSKMDPKIAKAITFFERARTNKDVIVINRSGAIANTISLAEEIYYDCYGVKIDETGWLKVFRRPGCNLTKEDIISFVYLCVRNDIGLFNITPRSEKDYRNSDDYKFLNSGTDYLGLYRIICFIAIQLELSIVGNEQTDGYYKRLVKYYFYGWDEYSMIEAPTKSEYPNYGGVKKIIDKNENEYIVVDNKYFLPSGKPIFYYRITKQDRRKDLNIGLNWDDYKKEVNRFSIKLHLLNASDNGKDAIKLGAMLDYPLDPETVKKMLDEKNDLESLLYKKGYSAEDIMIYESLFPNDFDDKKDESREIESTKADYLSTRLDSIELCLHVDKNNDRLRTEKIDIHASPSGIAFLLELINPDLLDPKEAFLIRIGEMRKIKEEYGF